MAGSSDSSESSRQLPSTPMPKQPGELKGANEMNAVALHNNDPLAISTQPIQTSATLVFLLATSLSLVTAPLVEPRYFIIPWVIWRLNVPAWRPGPISRILPKRLADVVDGIDIRLVFETLWFLAINFITGYIFLKKPYEWRAADGTILDEGRLQRFMW